MKLILPLGYIDSACHVLAMGCVETMMTAREIAEDLDIEPTHSHLCQIGHAMKRLGWGRAKLIDPTTRKQRWFYLSPDLVYNGQA